MIWIESRKPPLTSEVFHDYFHHKDILVKNMRERENGLFFILLSGFKIWFIVALIKVSLFKPFLSHTRDSCISCNGISGHGKSNANKSDLPVINIGNEKPCQHRVILDLLHFLTKIKTTNMFKTWHSEGRSHELFRGCWFISDDFPSFLKWFLLWCFLFTDIYVFLFRHCELEGFRNPRVNGMRWREWEVKWIA